MSGPDAPGEAVQEPELPARSRRTYPVVLVCLLLSAGISVWVLQRTWVTSSVTEPGLPIETETVTGATLYPASVAGAWLALACVVAIVATRGRWRSVVGVMVLLAAIATMVAAVAFPLTASIEFASTSLSSRPNLQVTTSSWWLVTGLCAVAIFACGIAVLRWSSQWRSLSSKQAGTASPELSDWEKLDRGLDPSEPSGRAEPVADEDK